MGEAGGTPTVPYTVDGTPCTLVNPDTGELFVAVPMATWRRVAVLARAVCPCAGSVKCTAPACQLAYAVVEVADEHERGEA